MRSVFQKEKICHVCGTTRNIHEHHIFFGTANRKLSEKRGLKVYLCYYHHNGSRHGVHFNKELDKQLKQMGQKYYEEHYGTRNDFIKEFGKNHFDDFDDLEVLD